MHSLIVKHYWLLIALTLWVFLASNYHCVLVAQQPGWHNED